jgi:hypothetical protein
MKRARILSQAVSVSVALEFWVTPVTWNVTERWLATEALSHGRLPFSRARVEAYRDDAWKCREEFFHLKLSDGDALKRFLTRWGSWRELNEAAAEENLPLPLAKSGVATYLRELLSRSVAESEIWTLQEQLKQALIKPPEEWLQQSSLTLEPRSQFPYFVIAATGIARALRMSVTLDLLQRVKFRLCARPDCRAPFKVKSSHGQKFCGRPYNCAHVMGMRRKRKQEQREAKKTKQGGNNGS